MLRNVDPTDSEVSRTLAPKHLPNGSESNVPEVKKSVPFFRESWGRFDVGKSFLGDNSKVTECDEMPRLESSPLLDGLDGVPASPEMPTLVPFAVDSEEVKGGLETHLSKNGYYRLNKENVNLSDPENPHLKNMSGISTSPLVPSSVTAKRRRGRPTKKKPRYYVSAEQATTDKRFQPVVVLKRLPVDEESVGSRSRDSSNDSWSQWPEEYEGCSYDDYVCEAEAVESFPEVDLIDGVEFLSFLQEGDVKEFALKDNQAIVFPSESSCTDMESCPDGTSSVKDDHAFIVPTKTRDITQIKGWKRKLFLDENFASTPSSISPSLLGSEGGEREDDSSQEALHSSRSSPYRSSLSGSRCSSNTPVHKTDESSAICTTSNSVNSGDDEQGEDSLREYYVEKSGVQCAEEDDLNTFERSFQDSLRLPGTPPESYGMSDEEEVEEVNEEVAEETLEEGQVLNDLTDMKDDNSEKGEKLEDEKLLEENSEPVKLNVQEKDEVEPEQHEMSDEGNVLLLGEQPDLYGTAKTSAFASRSLDDFLDKHSTLDVDFLKQCNPIMEFIPTDHPVLKVGSLKIDEEAKKQRWRFPVTVPSRYALPTKPSMRTPLHKKNVAKGSRTTQLTSATKENVGRTKSQINSSSATPSLPSRESENIKIVIRKKTTGSRIIFADEESAFSVSLNSEYSNSPVLGRTLSADISEVSNNEREELYSDSAILFQSSDVCENEKTDDPKYSNFFIDHYEPVTFEEAALDESKNKPFEVIRETVWSVKDTIREERFMYDLLCELKSPDSYLISKIKFDEESQPEVEELLTEDDAREIAKCVYMGYGSFQEMVKEISALEEAKKIRQAKSVQLARERKRKKEAQLKTVKKFVQWYREASVQSDKEETEINKKRQQSESPLHSHGPFANRAQKNCKRRRIRPPIRFLDGAPMSDDELLSPKDSEKLDKTYSVKLPVVRPHSAALPLDFDSSESTSNSSTAEPSVTTPDSTRLGVSNELPSAPSPQSSVESENVPSPASTTGSVDIIESLTSSEDEESMTPDSMMQDANQLTPMNNTQPTSPSGTTEQDQNESGVQDSSQSTPLSGLEAHGNTNQTSTESPDSGTQSYASNTTSPPSNVNSISLQTSPDNPKLMELNVTVPVYNKILDLIDEPAKKPDSSNTEKSTMVIENSKSVSSDPSCLGIVLNNGVHTITPRNSNHIERIKMNLNSAVSIGAEARKVIQRKVIQRPNRIGLLNKNVLHLIPLNEYQWTPSDSNKSPIIKSFLINSPNRKSDVVNMPLAAVAQPVSTSLFPNENVYLLYGTLDNLLPPVEETGTPDAFKGLSVRVGKQELLLSCSIALAKAPVRLNALVGKVVTPLLLYPALKSKEKSTRAPLTIQTAEVSASSTTSKDTAVSPATRPLLSPKASVSTVPLSPGQINTSLQSQQAQHFRIMTKDNKLMVESRLSGPAASTLAPMTRLPRSTLMTGPPRAVTQFSSLRFPRPGAPILETTIQSAAGPRKVLLLPRTSVLRNSVPTTIQAPNSTMSNTIVSSALYQSLTGGGPVTFPTGSMLQQALGSHHGTTQQVAASPVEGQYIIVQNPGTPVSKQPLQSSQNSGLSMIRKETLPSPPQQTKEIPTLHLIEQGSNIIMSAHVESTKDPPKVSENSDPEIQITDVRTCSAPDFDQDTNTVAQTSQTVAPSSPPSVVDIASDEEVDSLWISGEGETCFVMRLPDEDEQEDLTDEPQVVVCS